MRVNLGWLFCWYFLCAFGSSVICKLCGGVATLQTKGETYVYVMELFNRPSGIQGVL